MTLDAHPPVAKRVEHLRTFHNDTLVDQYEWLRDRDQAEVIEHLKAENAYTETMTQHLAALREECFQETVARVQETDVSVPVRRGEWWYYVRTTQGQQYAVTCRCPVENDSWEPPQAQAGQPLPGEQIVLDGNAEAEGHPFFSVGATTISPCGHFLAYSTDTQGNERYNLHIKDLRSGDVTGHTATDLLSDIVWSAASDYVFYAVVDDSWRPHQVHRLPVQGTEPVAAEVVYADPDPTYWIGVGTTTDHRFVLIASESKNTSEVLYVPADDPTATPRSVAGRRENVEYRVDHWDAPQGSSFLIVHNDQAQDFAISTALVGKSDPTDWVTVVPHQPGQRVNDVTAMKDAAVVGLRRDALIRVVILPRDETSPTGLGAGWEVPVEEELFTCQEVGNAEPAAPYVRIVTASFISPASVFDIDVASRELTLRKRTVVPGGYDPANYEQHRVWAKAQDGTSIPISLVCRQGTKPDGRGAVLLYGYGSYEHSIDPAMNPSRIPLVDRGVTFAVAHVRGGGEMGRPWYLQGRTMTKKNTFSDFVDCANFLVDEGWAAPDRIAASGGSAGGLLMGASLNLAPSRFCAVLLAVPFVDSLTTMLMPELPLTALEWEEWGNPIDDPSAYEYMKSYAPYENIQHTAYPPCLAVTSLDDTRVLYVEPAKWVAKMRAEAEGGPFLLKTEMDGGHGGASGRYQVWKDRAFEYAWLLEKLGCAG